MFVKRTLSTATTSIEETVCASTVPGHSNEQTAIVTEVRRPPVLGIGHQSSQVLLQSLVVQALESSGVVEILVQRVGGRCVLAEDVELQLIWPPIAVLSTAHTNVGLLERTFSHDCGIKSISNREYVGSIEKCFVSRDVA